MLRQLSIRNIVLIAQATVPFGDGLNVLTGETGAGKSILLDALGLALGSRAASGLVRQGEEQGSVSAEFDIAGMPHLAPVLEELGIALEAGETSLILRRSLTADGKGRAFVQDQPVSVAGLRAIGEMLVTIHGQHDQQGLQNAGLHRQVLDRYGKLTVQVGQVGELYRSWRAIASELEHLRAEHAAAQKEEEFLRHMVDELRQLDPQEGEEESLAAQRVTAQQREKYVDLLREALRTLSEPVELPAMLQSSMRLLGRSQLAASERFEPILESLDKAAIEVNEATAGLEELLREAEQETMPLEQLENRLFALRAAARKYQVAPAELPALLAQTEIRLGVVEKGDAAVAKAQARAGEAQQAFLAAAEKLSALRKKAAMTLQKAVQAELGSLHMGGTTLEVAVQELPESGWGEHGMDKAEFLVSTNPGAAAGSLQKIASGGELSRFMLALMVVLADTESPATMIFDEIDTGTGGAVADAIGARLAKLAGSRQVMVVTHLPQVAAKGAHHLRVEKAVSGGRTETRVIALEARQQQEELARMLAGAEITDEARKAAARLKAAS